jgi:hypothetical protein
VFKCAIVNRLLLIMDSFSSIIDTLFLWRYDYDSRINGRTGKEQFRNSSDV